MNPKVRFCRNQDMAVVRKLLEEIKDRDEGYIIDFLAKVVWPGSEKDTERFKELLTQQGIPFDKEATKIDEEGK